MSEMVLLGTSWKKFKMDDIFVFHKGKRLTKEDMTPGNTNFIAAIDDNNGIRQKIDLPPLHNGNCITVNYNGSIGESFYQDQPFRASDDVNILYPKKWELNRNIGLFLCTIIRHNKYRFGYGRKWNLEKMKDTNIALPVDKNGNPDWAFMDSYVEKLTNPEKIKTKIKHKELPFDTTKWKVFHVGDIFDLVNGKGITEKETISDPRGNIPCVQGGDNNCGILGYFQTDKIKNTKYTYIGKNCITLARVGSAGAVNFHTRCFIGDKAKALILLKKYEMYANKYVYLFLLPILALNKYRYAYGRGVVSENYKNLNIKLPVDKNGNPDWDYMEKYIKSLPYSDLI